MKRAPMDSAWLLLLLLALPLSWGCLCRAVLYHPTESDPALLAIGGWEAARLESGGVTLNGLVRPPASSEAPWVLYFGGNAMSLASSQEVLTRLAGDLDVGLAVFAYRGYDGSGGRPRKKRLLPDAVAVARHLERAHGVAPDRLVLAGQSLGSGIAAHVAAELAREGRPARGLALVSPYTSMARVFDDHVPLFPIGWTIAESYRTDRLVDDLSGPVVIVHGDADEVIAVRHGRRLAESLGERATYFELPGRAHNDLWEDPRTVDALRSLLR